MGPSDLRFCRGSRGDTRVRESPSSEGRCSHLLDMRLASRWDLPYATLFPLLPSLLLELGKLLGKPQTASLKLRRLTVAFPF